MSGSLRLPRVTVAVAVAALGLAACGGDDDSSPAESAAAPSDGASVSADAPVDTGGATAEADESAPPAEGAAAGGAAEGEVVPGEQLAERVLAAVVAAGSARSELTSTVDGSTITSEGVIDFSQPYRLDITTTISAEGGDITSRVVAVSESEIYVRIPDADQWFLIDAGDDGGLLGDLGTEYYSPDDTWTAWGASGDFEVIGRETVEGVDTTHYRLTAGEAGAALADGLSSVDVWIGADDLPVKVDVGVTEPVSTVSLVYTEWGVPVDIQPPPADEILEF